MDTGIKRALSHYSQCHWHVTNVMTGKTVFWNLVPDILVKCNISALVSKNVVQDVSMKTPDPFHPVSSWIWISHWPFGFQVDSISSHQVAYYYQCFTICFPHPNDIFIISIILIIYIYFCTAIVFDVLVPTYYSMTGKTFVYPCMYPQSMWGADWMIL